MPTRSEELRAWNRKVFGWSYALAGLLLAFVFFVWSPEYSVEPMTKEPDVQREESTAAVSVPVFVQLLFAPPTILALDGTERTEPETRVLETGSLLELPSACLGEVILASGDISGSVRLRVNLSGEATASGIVESTESACGDQLILAAAGALRYHWLPSVEFPAPVELVQPVLVLDVAEAL